MTTQPEFKNPLVIPREPCDHKYSEWKEVVKQPKKRELLSMRFCHKCWKKETKTERIDL